MPKLPEKHLNFASLQSSKRRFVYLEYAFYVCIYLSGPFLVLTVIVRILRASFSAREVRWVVGSFMLASYVGVCP